MCFPTHMATEETSLRMSLHLGHSIKGWSRIRFRAEGTTPDERVVFRWSVVGFMVSHKSSLKQEYYACYPYLSSRGLLSKLWITYPSSASTTFLTNVPSALLATSFITAPMSIPILVLSVMPKLSFFSFTIAVISASLIWGGK